MNRITHVEYQRAARWASFVGVGVAVGCGFPSVNYDTAVDGVARMLACPGSTIVAGGGRPPRAGRAARGPPMVWRWRTARRLTRLRRSHRTARSQRATLCIRRPGIGKLQLRVGLDDVVRIGGAERRHGGDRHSGSRRQHRHRPRDHRSIGWGRPCRRDPDRKGQRVIERRCDPARTRHRRTGIGRDDEVRRRWGRLRAARQHVRRQDRGLR